jgi:DNA-directed RNA polymerase specialized sigma24 family protein
MASDFAGDCEGADRMGLGEEIEAVRRALVELDPLLLQAVVMRYFCEMKSHEIANVLEWNSSTVRCRLREARLILARKLMKRGIEP